MAFFVNPPPIEMPLYFNTLLVLINDIASVDDDNPLLIAAADMGIYIGETK